MSEPIPPAGPVVEPVAEPASSGNRVSAYFVDWAIGAIIAFGGGAIVAAAAGQGMVAPSVILVFSVLLLLVLLLYGLLYLAFLGRGASWGMLAMGIRLDRVGDDDPPGFALALLRALLFWLGSAIVVGAFSPFFDGSGRRQGWHDLLTRTWIVDARTAPKRDAGERHPLEQHVALAALPAEESDGLSILLAETQPEADRAVAPVSAPAFVLPVPVLEEPVPAPIVAEPEPPARVVTPLQPLDFVPGAAQPAAHLASPSWGPPAPLPSDDRGHFDSSGFDSSGFESSGFGKPADEDLGNTVIRGPIALRIRLDSGEAHEVAGTTLVGRKPVALPGETVAGLVEVDDPAKSISKSHLALQHRDGLLWVVDRGSTNGTRVLRSDGTRVAVSAADPVLVRPGDRVRFGDRYFTVELSS